VAFGDGTDDFALRAAWHDFCDSLKASGDLAFKDANPASSLQRADAFRFLTQALGQAFDLGLETRDPQAPGLHAFCGPRRKLGADCADFAYHQAWIDGASSYRLSGDKGSARFFNVTVQGARPDLHPGTEGHSRNLHEPFGDAPEANIFGHQIETDADGCFELIIGGERAGANWLPTTPDSRKLFIRQGFDGWDEIPAKLHIERLGMDCPAPLPASGRMIEAIGWARDFLSGCMTDWPDLQLETGLVMQPGLLNAFPGMAEDSGNQQRGRTASIMQWRLAPDEALVINFDEHPAFWSFTNMGVFCNSMDYLYRPVSYTPARTPRDRDGRIRLVMAHEDPGYANWIDSQGFETGFLAFRTMMSAEAPLLGTDVVKSSDLAGVLSGSLTIDDNQRRAELEVRYRAICDRFGL
jgi:Protein of unknown function (DUF1214)